MTSSTGTASTTTTKTCGCTATARCAKHLINDALDMSTAEEQLVEKASAISLADLYRKAKKRGVLGARSNYQ